MDTTEQDIERGCSDLVAREVVYCVSTLIYDLTTTDRGNPDDLADDAEQNIELWSPVIGDDAYIECAEDNGATWERGGDDDEGDWSANDTACDWHTTQGQAAKEYCEVHNLDPQEYAGEVYEHWIVSDWLARKLEARDERIVRDWHGLTIWARTTTGQAISMDEVIRDIYRDLHAAK